MQRETLHDVHLAEIVARLLDLWAHTPKAERGGLSLAMSALLDLIGARDRAARGHTVAAESWTIDTDEVAPDDPSDPTASR